MGTQNLSWYWLNFKIKVASWGPRKKYQNTGGKINEVLWEIEEIIQYWIILRLEYLL